MYEIIYQDIEENSKYEKTIKKVVEKCFEEEGISDSKLCLTDYSSVGSKNTG